MSNNVGPEDTQAWKTNSDKERITIRELCRRCKNKMLVPHCSNIGCVWCKACFESVKTRPRGVVGG